MPLFGFSTTNCIVYCLFGEAIARLAIDIGDWKLEWPLTLFPFWMLEVSVSVYVALLTTIKKIILVLRLWLG